MFRADRGAPERILSPESGVAFILVLTCLLTLLVIALPFAVTSRSDYRAAVAVDARIRARLGAEQALEMARWRLLSTTFEMERQGNGAATPYHDAEEEFRVMLDLVDDAGRPLPGPDGQPLLRHADPRGELWDAVVEDEQARIHAGSAPPFLFGALVGRTTLAAELDETATVIEVASTEGFPAEKGRVVIERELIEYERTEGSRFLNCRRGAGEAERFGPAGRAAAGVPVFNAVAFDLALYDAGGAEPRAYTAPTAVKDAARSGGSALTDGDLDRILGKLTVHSWRPSRDGLALGERILNDLRPEDGIPKGLVIQVQNPDFFSRGATVEISDGTTRERHLVYEARRQGPGGMIRLYGTTQNTFAAGTATIRAEVRHPVNINACARDVLVMLMDRIEWTSGGGGREGEQSHTITEDLARIVADEIIRSRPVTGYPHLARILKGLYHRFLRETGGESAMTVFQALAIYANAVNPNDRTLRHSTVPFAFRSMDRFMITGAASINNAGGIELARVRLRDHVRVAAPGDQIFTLTHQVDFSEFSNATRAARHVESWPASVARFQGATSYPPSEIPRHLYRFRQEAGEGIFPSETEGELRLRAFRMPATGFAQHFDGAQLFEESDLPTEMLTPEGMPTGAGGFILPMQRGGTGRSLTDGLGGIPAAVDFWFRPTGGIGSPRTLFQAVGTDADEDHVTLDWDPGRGELRLRVHDRTLRDAASGFEETAEVTWQPPPGVIIDDGWQHLGASYRGTKPEDLLLFVDGFRRGRQKYRTTLTTDLSTSDQYISVEDAADWPRQGAAWVGREVVEFSAISGNQLQVRRYPDQSSGRGARGTTTMAHRNGEPVTLFGYSTLLTTASGTSGLVLTEGGGRLASELGPFNIVAIGANATRTFPGATPQAPPVTVEVYDPAAANGTSLVLEQAAGAPADFSGFQTSGGYVIIVSRPFGTGSGALSAGIELLRYASASQNPAGQGLVLSGLSPVPNPANPDLLVNAVCNIQVGQQQIQIPISLQRTVHAVRNPNNGQRLALCFPISVHLSRTSGYRVPDPSITNPDFDTDYELVQIGVPDVANLASHRIEWIRYHHVAESDRMLLLDERELICDAATVCYAQLFGQGAGGGPFDPAPVEQVLRFRSQGNTTMFGWSWSSQGGTPRRHGTGEEVVPVFRTVRFGAGQTTTAGYGDSATLEIVSGTERARVRFDVAWTGARSAVSAKSDDRDRVAFTRNTGAPVAQTTLPPNGIDDARRYTRILRFPSGELPDLAGGTALAGSDAAGKNGGEGLIDEIRITEFGPRSAQAPSERYVVWDEVAVRTSAQSTAQTPQPDPLIARTETEIPVADIELLVCPPLTPPPPNVIVRNLPDGRRIQTLRLTGLPNDAGLVQIGNEIIAFRRAGQGSRGVPALLDCIRGFMGTDPEDHAFGSNVVFLDFVPVTMLLDAIDPKASEIPVVDGRDFPSSGGTALIDGEMVHWTDKFRGPGLLRGPVVREGEGVRGAFRGRFGTRSQAHDAESIVLMMPFRYWDRFVPECDDPELGYFQFDIDEPSMFFRSLDFSERLPKPHLGLRILVRTDPRIPWDARPNERPGLWLFDRPKDQNHRNTILAQGSGLSARIFFAYQPGAFDGVTLEPQSWKETPILLDVTVDGFAPTVVASREELK